MGKFHQQKEEKRQKVTYKLTVAQIEQIKRDAVEEAVKVAMTKLIGLTCLVLHNSFGFGKKRCTAVVERLLDMFGSMDKEGGYTLAQVEQAGWDLGGVKRTDYL